MARSGLPARQWPAAAPEETKEAPASLTSRARSSLAEFTLSVASGLGMTGDG
jgi:hypothetical protein